MDDYTAMRRHLPYADYDFMEEEDYDEEETRILELRAQKESTLSRFTPEVRKKVDSVIDELLCETIFNIHRDLKLGILDPSRYDSNYIRRSNSPNLVQMAEQLNITKPTQEVDCPKCSVPVKCLLLSKHLALCMNPHQNTYSYSSRNSSRIARQRIQEGFKTAYDESKNDSEDERVKPKRRNNKGKKSTVKSVRDNSRSKESTY
ncbi:uncharacterized protein LOC100158688 [Acyrthosiphon pisum]|uniref:SAGA-associated factor 11 n=1 Tax=Acyrthosiphon pisum TaxID=7029 RepID=A0A8R1W4K9_ACYPI|nr:uncharacterized protein LOC100158688 [Acyrthosiphon pisum]|eukprot:XP_001949926.2 PREDICTED: uncharacterized protein LOC100158688 [Acyrthosiphon pisum]